jgi:hypothetical protein
VAHFAWRSHHETEVSKTGRFGDVLHDYVTFGAGKFLSPLGYFRRNLHPAWINKLPSRPPGFSNGQAASVAEIGEGFQSPGSQMAMPAKGGNPDLTRGDLVNVLSYIREHFQP